MRRNSSALTTSCVCRCAWVVAHIAALSGSPIQLMSAVRLLAASDAAYRQFKEQLLPHW